MKHDMGGLGSMPVHVWTFISARSRLAGIFRSPGFWSKDEILVNAGEQATRPCLIIG